METEKLNMMIETIESKQEKVLLDHPLYNELLRWAKMGLMIPYDHFADAVEEEFEKYETL